MKRYYGAYGSNLNLEQMKKRCPDSKVFGKAILEDYRLMYKGSESEFYLTIEKEEGYKVPIGVWEVSEADELSLDVYEDYPNLYYKKDFQLEVNGKLETVFIYIMHEDRELGEPSSRYVNTCLQGYKDFDFPEEILKKALR